MILLFGSRAGKNYCPSSDFDIAIDGEKMNIRELRELKEEIENVFVYTPDEFIEMKKNFLCRELLRKELLFLSQENYKDDSTPSEVCVLSASMYGIDFKVC